MPQPSGIQEVLQAAADIKAAQLKARPGRQDWETAPDFIKYTALHDEEIEAVRARDLEQRLAVCREFKTAGNKAYDEDAEKALSLYTKALSVFVWFDRGKDRANEDIPYINTASTLDEGGKKAEVDALLAVLFNNCATCLMKLHKSDAAVYAASKALESDPYNVKALFRRAHAHHSKGSTSSLEAAVNDLQRAVKLEPGNIQVRASLAAFLQELQQQTRKEASLYRSMLTQGQLYDDEDEDQAADQGTGVSDDRKPLEAAKAVKSLQQNLQRARMSEHIAGPPAARQSPFTALPLWAWALIVLHMSYRVIKIFRLNVPGLNLWGGTGAAESDGHDEL